MIKIKIDECLPNEIAENLKENGYIVDTVKDENLQGSPDDVIWSTVKKEGRFLFTADLDFSDIRDFIPGTHPGILLFRLNKEGKSHLISYVKILVSEYNLNEWSGCMVVATDHKIRIRKPEC